MKHLRLILICSFFMISCEHLSPHRDTASLSVYNKEEQILPLKEGSFHNRVTWGVGPASSHDILIGHIEFIPKTNASWTCENLRMIQTAKLETKMGKNFQWTLAETPRNEQRTKASFQVEDGFFVDHLAENCKKAMPCSPYYRDHWPSEDKSQDGYLRSTTDMQPVSLQDYPFGWNDFERIKLEACAVCVETQKIYGCAKWGAVWPSAGVRKILPLRADDSPSETFLKAVENFHKYYQ